MRRVPVVSPAFFAVSPETGIHEPATGPVFTTNGCNYTFRQRKHSGFFRIFDVVCICLIDYEQIMKDSHEIS